MVSIVLFDAEYARADSGTWFRCTVAAGRMRLEYQPRIEYSGANVIVFNEEDDIVVNDEVIRVDLSDQLIYFDIVV